MTVASSPLLLSARSSIREIAPAAWDRLLGADDQPFVRHAFLSALEQSGSLRAELGWTPMPLLLQRDGVPVAAAPGYLKTNSHGEFVFDWAWADAYVHHRVPYYPKLLIGVPYTPVPGPRLLVGGGTDACALRHQLLTGILDFVTRTRLSSAHINFPCEADAAACAHDPWLPRFDWQYHFHNPGYADFDALLAQFNHKKRKNIRHERKRAHSHGLQIRWADGPSFSEADLDDLHTLYIETFDRKGNTPALTREFFSLIREAMPEQFHAALACRDGRILAAAIFFSSSTTLYGRYWGAREDYADLHFELCYYQGLEYALRRGLKHFEPGAQGEHKIARGFVPTRTRSAHFIARPDFRRAIRAAIDRESHALREYQQQMTGHLPFRCDDSPTHAN